MLISALKRVFSKFSYTLLAFTVGWFIFSISVFAPNLKLISKVFKSEVVSAKYKINFIFNLYEGLDTSVSTFSLATIISVAVLFGINIAMLVYMLKRNVAVSVPNRQGKNIFSTFVATIAGVLGIGCAACGSLILTPLITALGATWILTALPFGGREFSLVAIILILISIYSLCKKINDPLICPVE
ncbi:MAG: hypothetical protein A2728_01785 [Candidatus Spechtbacteria bacterium RIFCSPHIGHO2_01_FULL_38_11]|nr:MAG: hypothetical protein A2728_01785 [Candidatus Spechtbacteria bacterium RIFCSPHIGHO2_01_FULL_38_11]